MEKKLDILDKRSEIEEKIEKLKVSRQQLWKEIERLEEEQKKSYVILNIEMFLLVIFNLILLIWTKSLIVGICLGFVLGMWVAMLLDWKCSSSMKFDNLKGGLEYGRRT